eukprot:CAMPEP_0117683376 /NCGR_PEP_ID=MMETSP0804-20121206/20355_1 /TAXON_ID=1074897 /ORGANISM="Tetraselmis astigmatica, Strain CCMP880" /LENGTH=426 /DNA_ID=CAMNT_0005493941 /DNA_START=56 /DNA_END=1336 /DNA_ORIENTATION=-
MVRCKFRIDTVLPNRPQLNAAGHSPVAKGMHRSRPTRSRNQLGLAALLCVLALAATLRLAAGQTFSFPTRRGPVGTRSRRGQATGTAPQRRRQGPPVDTEPNTWYPKFTCDLEPMPKLSFPTPQKKTTPCVQLPLPKEALRFADNPPPAVRPDVNTTHPGYLFVFGTPYGGTTALLGLLSSSPKVTVPVSGWAHEAHWQLGNHKIYPFQKLARSHTPQQYWTDYKYDPTVDMEEMTRELDMVWDHSRSIRVDKSHSFIGQAPQLYQYYRARGSVVKFIVLVRHPCTYGHQKKMPGRYLRDIRRFRRVLEDFPGDSLLVLYDEYVRDPQAAADAILRFFPELNSLDITQTSLTEKQTTLNGGQNKFRGQATGGEGQEHFYQNFVLNRMQRVKTIKELNLAWCEGFPAARKEILPEEGLSLLRFFGFM